MIGLLLICFLCAICSTVVRSLVCLAYRRLASTTGFRVISAVGFGHIDLWKEVSILGMISQCFVCTAGSKVANGGLVFFTRLFLPPTD